MRPSWELPGAYRWAGKELPNSSQNRPGVVPVNNGRFWVRASPTRHSNQWEVVMDVLQRAG